MPQNIVETRCLGNTQEGHTGTDRTTKPVKAIRRYHTPDERL